MEEKYSKTGFLRLILVIAIWMLILLPAVFFIPLIYIPHFAAFYEIWCIIGYLISPDIVIKIWKK